MTGSFVPPEHGPERDAEAFRMKSRSRTLSEIALALGYVDASHAHKAIKRHVERRVAPAADEYIALMDDQLDHMYRETMRVLETTHYKVNDGRVVYFAGEDCTCATDGISCTHAKPLKDDAPVLAAVDRMLKIQERRAKLYGLDKPVKHDVSVSNVTVRVEGADDV